MNNLCLLDSVAPPVFPPPFVLSFQLKYMYCWKFVLYVCVKISMVCVSKKMYLNVAERSYSEKTEN